jgi:hypothetical protein
MPEPRLNMAPHAMGQPMNYYPHHMDNMGGIMQVRCTIRRRPWA